MAGCKAGSRVQRKSAVEGGGGGGVDVSKFKKPSFIYNNCCPCICGGFCSTPSLHSSRWRICENGITSIVTPDASFLLSLTLTTEHLKDQNMTLMERLIRNLLDPNCRETAMLKLSKDNDVEAISFLLSVEMVPVCLRIMENSSELSKKVAAFIVHKIMLNEVGIGYMCATPEHLFAVCHVLNRMVQSLAKKPSQRLLKHIIHCYLRLSEYTRMMLQQNSVCSNCYIMYQVQTNWLQPASAICGRLSVLVT